MNCFPRSFYPKVIEFFMLFSLAIAVRQPKSICLVYILVRVGRISRTSANVRLTRVVCSNRSEVTLPLMDTVASYILYCTNTNHFDRFQ